MNSTSDLRFGGCRFRSPLRCWPKLEIPCDFPQPLYKYVVILPSQKCLVVLLLTVCILQNIVKYFIMSYFRYHCYLFYCICEAT